MLLLISGAYSTAWGQQANSLSPANRISPERQTPDARRQVDAAVYFRIGESRIDPDFEGNGTRLARFVTTLRQILADSNYVVSHVKVAGTASPDGTEPRNLQLADARAKSLATYMQKHAGIDPKQIEIINGGENWTGLRAMIETSDMPHKTDMLRLMDQHPADRDARKHAMQFYADSKPWLWMYERFFPSLRRGGGGTQLHKDLSRLSLDNWTQLRRLIEGYPLDNERKRALLDAVDQEPNASQRMSLLREISGNEDYSRLQEHLLTGLLSESSSLSIDNWTVLRERIARDDTMPGRQQALDIIDHIPAPQGRELRLQNLDQGVPYAYIKEHYFPELLVCTTPPSPEVYLGARGEVSESTLSAENWKRLRAMIWVSQMPDKAAVLEMIDSTPDAVACEAKLRTMNSGATYRYIQAVFFPELLYGISPTAQQNWDRLARQVEESDMENKSRILEILRTTPARLEREEALRSLDNGQTWNRLSDALMSELLLSTEVVPMTGSGVSFYYELSPRNRWFFREPSASELAVADSAATTVSGAKAGQADASVHPLHPLFSLKTNLTQWAGLTPAFDIATFMPNLSAEVYFARRWSVEAGALYANWDAFSGNKFYAVSNFYVEPRIWFRGDGQFRGFYAGVCGSYGDFDYQADKNEGTDNATGTFWNAGVSAGFVQPLSQHWALELGLTGSYRSAAFDRYTIERDATDALRYYFDSSATQGKFVPGVRVNVVYRFAQ